MPEQIGLSKRFAGDSDVQGFPLIVEGGSFKNDKESANVEKRENDEKEAIEDHGNEGPVVGDLQE